MCRCAHPTTTFLPPKGALPLTSTAAAWSHQDTFLLVTATSSARSQSRSASNRVQQDAAVNFNLTQVPINLTQAPGDCCSRLSVCSDRASQPLNAAISFTSLWIFSFVIVYKTPSLDFACVENLAESCHPFDLIFSRVRICLSSCLYGTFAAM